MNIRLFLFSMLTLALFLSVGTLSASPDPGFKQIDSAVSQIDIGASNTNVLSVDLASCPPDCSQIGDGDKAAATQRKRPTYAELGTIFDNDTDYVLAASAECDSCHSAESRSDIVRRLASLNMGLKYHLGRYLSPELSG